MSLSTRSRSLSKALESVTPGVKHIDEFFLAFGGRWPPRPSFDWPECFHGYHRVWEMAVERFDDVTTPGHFRKWMRKELRKQINLNQVLEELRPRLWLHDKVMLGLLGCIQFSICFYRWGTCPQTADEINRETLEFPIELWTPFTMITVLIGVPPHTSIFNLCFAAAEYSSENSISPAVSLRYHWSKDPDIRSAENKFFLTFCQLDACCKPCLMIIRKYLIYTHVASMDKFKAKALLNQRVQLLGDLRSTFLNLTTRFLDQFNKMDVTADVFSDHVLGMASWELEGKEGVTSRELLCFSLFYAFLASPPSSSGHVTVGTDGAHCGIQMLPEVRSLPTRCRQLLECLATDEIEARFDSFLGLSEDTDPLLLAREELVQSLYMWGLGQDVEYASGSGTDSRDTGAGLVRNWAGRVKSGLQRCRQRTVNSLLYAFNYIRRKLRSCLICH